MENVITANVLYYLQLHVEELAYLSSWSFQVGSTVLYRACFELSEYLESNADISDAEMEAGLRYMSAMKNRATLLENAYDECLRNAE